MPSMEASAGAQSGTSSRAASRPVTPAEMPSPNSAVAIGSPAAGDPGGPGGGGRGADPLGPRRAGGEPVDRRLRRGGVAGLPDHVDGVGAALREAVGEELRRGARLRSGRRVVGRPVAGEAGGGERGDEADGPGGDD